ncbi:MAG: hypothetical protein ACRD27_07860, partial [Terracidiphilus sp.]
MAISILLGALPGFGMLPAALLAQPSAASRRTLPSRRSLAVRRRAAASRAVRQPALRPEKSALPVQAAAPEASQWPVNGPPAQPSVTWDGHALRIDAMNASLRQILKEVTAETGAKVKGFGADQRIFGVYGPGKPHEVLAQLLDGTGYNVIIVGSHGADAPLQIVLSAPASGPAPSTSNYTPDRGDEDMETQESPAYPAPPVMRSGLI